MRKRLLIALGLLISGLFIWLAVRNASWEEIRSAFAQAELAWAIPLLLSLGLFYWLKAQRWSMLLRPSRDLGASSLVPSLIVGFASNNLLPARIGELLRVYLAAEEFSLPKASVLATIVLERLFDLLSILFFASMVVLLGEHAQAELKAAILFIGVVALTSATMMFLLLRFTDATSRFLTRVFALFPERIAAWLGRQLSMVRGGLASLEQSHLTYRVLANSLVQWGFMALCIFFATRAFGLDLPATAPFIVLALVVAGITLPSAPGFVGVIEYCFVLGLGSFGVNPSVALGAALFYHALTWGSVTIVGLICARRYGQGFGQLRESVE